MHTGQVRQEWNNQKEKEKAKEGTSKEDDRRAAKADQEQVRGANLCWEAYEPVLTAHVCACCGHSKSDLQACLLCRLAVEGRMS